MKRGLFLGLVGLFLFHSVLQSQFLEVSDNNRFLVTKEGKPFFWLADTGWEMLHRLDRNEMEYYMRNRAAKGFTVIQTVILSEIDGVTFPNMEGNLPLVDFDIERPNEDYFDLVDYAVQKAEEYDLVLALLPTWHRWVLPGSHPLENEKPVIDKEGAFIFGKFLGERYKDAPNILWVLGGDWPAGPQIEVWDALAKGLEEGDGHRHLKTYHPRGGQTSSTWLHQRDWLDFNMIQTGHMEPSFPVYEWVFNDYALSPSKPVLNGEPAYESIGICFNPVNGRHDDYEVRKQAYWSVFAGAFGHTYGNNNIWQMNRNDGNGRIWPDQTWDEALDSPGSGQMGHLRALMESRPFLTRFPDQGILSASRPSHSSDYVTVTRDGTPGEKDASYIMAYLPYIRGAELNTGIINGDTLKIWWFNPQNGYAFPRGLFENTGTYKVDNWTTPFREGDGGPDWVLVIDDASAGYAAPGIR